MPIYRVGVQATNSSAGQGVDFDGGSFASDLSLVNVSGESVAYSTNGGTAWTTVSAGASASIGSIAQDQFRLRRVASGAYPLPVDVDVTAVSALTPPEVFAIQALVSGGRNLILNSQSAGADTVWLPLGAFPERFIYQLTSGTTTTTFQMDISADGVTSLGTAFTGTWASSTLAYITQPVAISNPQAKFFRWTVLTGGPLSIARYV